jgi:hypothetical protein
MVALLGLLELREVGLELLVVAPGRAVDALQLLVLLVAAPVGAGHAHELERAELVRVRHVRAATEVHPVTLPVERDLLPGRNDVVDDLGLEVLALALEQGDRRVLGHDAALHRQGFADDPGHLGLDLREVFGAERRGARKIVVEAVLDHRPDGDLGVGKQALHGLGQQVRRGVPDDVERIGMLVGDDLERGIALDAERQIDQLAVDLAGQRGLGQTGADGGGDTRDVDRAGEFTAAAVGERDVDHGEILSSKQKGRRSALRSRDEGSGGASVQQRSVPVRVMVIVFFRTTALWDGVDGVAGVTSRSGAEPSGGRSLGDAEISGHTPLRGRVVGATGIEPVTPTMSR